MIHKNIYSSLWLIYFFFHLVLLRTLHITFSIWKVGTTISSWTTQLNSLPNSAAETWAFSDFKLSKVKKNFRPTEL